jgi:hypothetical protein
MSRWIWPAKLLLPLPPLGVLEMADLAPLPAILLEPLVRNALLEDLCRAGDLTTAATVPRTPSPPWRWSPVSKAYLWPRRRRSRVPIAPAAGAF